MNISPPPCPDNQWAAWHAPIAIPTAYRGCRFRSRLEARWAVFFDKLHIGWTYEPQGYRVGRRAYLPDFLLECGTWVEVKGHDDALDKDLMRAATVELPMVPDTVESSPRLLILGPTPLLYPDVPLQVDPASRGWSWLAFWPDGRDDEIHHDEVVIGDWAWRYKSRPVYLNEPRDLSGSWVRPLPHDIWGDEATMAAYAAAAGARFEHGERGAGR